VNCCLFDRGKPDRLRIDAIASALWRFIIDKKKFEAKVGAKAQRNPTSDAGQGQWARRTVS